MRVLLAILLCLWAGLADAQSGRKVVLLGGGVPSWVLRAGGVPANADLNFATGQYYGCTLASCLSITRASAKTNLLPSSVSGFAYATFGNNVLAITPGSGLLIEEARTNQLLTSTVPATQTTGSLANGTYTLWVNGSGTATMSAGTATGCGTGVASNGTPVNFTTSGAAGTCTVTVAGSLNAFQIELGAFGTSLIVTAGATATRAADNISAAGSLSINLQLINAGIIAQTVNLPNNFTSAFIGANGLNVFGTSGNQLFSSNGSTNLFGPAITGASANKSGFSWAATPSRFLVINNGTVSAAVDGKQTFVGTYFVGSTNGTANPIDGYLSRLSIIPGVLTQAQIKALTQ